MIGHYAARAINRERTDLEIPRRNIHVSQQFNPMKPDTTIVGGVTENHAPRRGVVDEADAGVQSLQV